MNRPDRETLLAAALERHQAGRLEEAFDLYGRVLAADPDDADANHLLGLLAHQLGKLELATELISRAVGAKPRESAFYVNLGNVLQARGKLRLAVTCFNKALRLDPETAEAHFNLGNALFTWGRLKDAVAAYQLAVAGDPQSAMAHYNLGVALLADGRPDAAVAPLQQALMLEPRDGRIHFNLGIAFQRSGQPEDAVRTFGAATRIEPDNAEAHVNLGNVLQELGSADEAVACFRRAIRVRPDYAEAYFNLGNALKRAGDLDAAVGAYRKAIEIRPGHADAHYNLHAVLFDDENPAAARACLVAALGADGRHNLSRFYLSVIEERMGNGARAEALRSQFREDAPGLAFLLASWDYVRANTTPRTRFFAENYRTLDHALSQASVDGLVLEFGVAHGFSIRHIGAGTDGPVHGFDSFEGLPEAWGSNPKGTYSTGGRLPEVPGNVRLHVGPFDTTLPPFVAAHDGPVRLVNIDCDLYSATKTVLRGLDARIVAGTVIVFDEYICNSQWREHEFKAFQEFVVERHLSYEYLAFNLFTKQAVLRVT